MIFSTRGVSSGALLLVLACGDDGSPPTGETASTAGTTMVGTSAQTTSATTLDTTTGQATDTTTTSGSSMSTTGPTSSTTASTAPGCESPQTTGNADTGSMGYVFRETPFCDYARIDRVGFPLVTTLFIESDDEYNAAVQNNAFVFQPEVTAAVMALHAALDTALAADDWTPCFIGTCNAQMNGFLFPDGLRLNLDDGDAFPNGRRVDEPTLDLVLALALLDLGVHPIDAFAAASLGPQDNDVTLPGQWPFVADPQ